MEMGGGEDRRREREREKGEEKGEKEKKEGTGGEGRKKEGIKSNIQAYLLIQNSLFSINTSSCMKESVPLACLCTVLSI